MSPELRALMTRARFYRENVLAVGRQLPADDAVVAQWLDEAAGTRDIEQFVFVLFGALATDRKVDARHLVRGLPLLPNAPSAMCVTFKLEGDVAAAMAEAV